ncbi:MAG: hypothetical protein JSU05_01405 [Bacteroidetes bacterium]|nr:hypothetical protein [Bacteroidota bacterium]
MIPEQYFNCVFYRYKDPGTLTLTQYEYLKTRFHRNKRFLQSASLSFAKEFKAPLQALGFNIVVMPLLAIAATELNLLFLMGFIILLGLFVLFFINTCIGIISFLLSAKKRKTYLKKLEEALSRGLTYDSFYELMYN